MTLSPDDFRAFFQEVYGHEPFPWQDRLLRTVAQDNQWPATLDLPTGSGKTAAIDVAVFHLALEARSGLDRRAAVRIAFVVDRRLVVDDAFERAKKLANALEHPSTEVMTRVADRLRALSADAPPLIARRLRGGIPREDDWARTPSQPTVLCSTIDQVGSRLLFRGYGVSDTMKPVHAGLIGSDCLMLLDEAHLAEPFRQTLGWVGVYRSERWRRVKASAPWAVALLTATAGAGVRSGFSLTDEDRAHPVLSRRLNASKPARLIGPPKRKRSIEEGVEAGDADGDVGEEEVDRRAAALAGEVLHAIAHFATPEHGAPAPAIAVVVNRVARARAVFERLKRELGDEIQRGVAAGPILMIGPARPLDRDELSGALDPIRTRHFGENEVRVLSAPLIVVATQCIEAGVDIDLDGLITEAAALDALRQRFGRLNRAGRKIVPFAAVVADKADLSPRADDAVYGTAVKDAWEYLTARADRRTGGVAIVDLGLDALDRLLRKSPVPETAIAEKADAPILLPAHLDLLSQTSPVPATDPDVALYLHGPRRQPDSITVVWRADVSPERTDRDTRRLLMLAPPRQTEAIELPVWAVRAWLTDRRLPWAFLADVAAGQPDNENRSSRGTGRLRAFRWKGDDDRSQWIGAAGLRPGDTIIVPADYGGTDRFGWDPRSTAIVSDLGSTAAEPFAGRRFTVRVAPGLLGSGVSAEILSDALGAAVTQRWNDLRAALLDLDLPDAIRRDLHALDRARGKRIIAYTDLYGIDDVGRPRGVVFHAPLGIEDMSPGAQGAAVSSEDDVSGSLTGFALPLETHCRDVEKKAESFARAARLPPDRVADLTVAGRLHDLGKADSRFQAWLHYGDPLGPDPAHVLAKSDRHLPREARDASTLPEHWRHEALSVRLAKASADLRSASDPDLVLWLIGTHHGHGRPLFPHSDSMETAPDIGPQSLRFEWNGLDWPMLFEELKARYGVWELARMEAVLRLADHRASEERAAGEALP